jgi:dihydrofolate reductase
LIDEYWINLNPVALGEGKPLFRDLKEQMNLKLLETKAFKSGIIALHYATS